MEAKDIKLKRVRQDEFRVHHVLTTSTKHLPEGTYAHKHYSYTLYTPDGKILEWDQDHLHDLKAVKEYIANYDKMIDERNARIEAEKEANRLKFEAEKAHIRKITNEFIKPINDTPQIIVGDNIWIHESNLSKPASVGEAFDSIDPKVRIGVVCHVSTVDSDTFDSICTNVYNMDSSLLKMRTDENDHCGGQFSDDPTLDGVNDIDEVMQNPVMKKVFMDTYKIMIQVIVAPNRKPLLIDTSGYNYPRYIVKQVER